MCLEPGYGLGFPGGPDRVHGGAHADRSLDGLQILIQGDEHARVHAQDQVVQEVVILADEEALHVCAGVEHGDQACEGHVREQELVRVQRVKPQKALTHVHQALGDADHEELVCAVCEIGRYVPQVACETVVISASADQTKSEYGAHRHVDIGVICELVE